MKVKLCILVLSVFLLTIAEIDARRRKKAKELSGVNGLFYIQFVHEETYDLSPWELHVVNDLMMQIMLLKCKNVNETVARDLKTFITSRVTKAPRRQVMDRDFFSIYSKMVKCMDHIDSTHQVKSQNYPAPASKKQQETKIGDETEGDHDNSEYYTETDNMERESEDFNAYGKPKKAKDQTENILSMDSNHIKPTEKANVESESATESVQPSFSSKLWKWISSLGRKKRAVVSDDFEVSSQKQNAPKKSKIGHLESARKKQVLNKYREVLEDLSRIVSGSCPLINARNKIFISKAIKEIVHWIGTDLDVAIEAFEKYFLHAYTPMELKKCLADEVNNEYRWVID